MSSPRWPYGGAEPTVVWLCLAIRPGPAFSRLHDCFLGKFFLPDPDTLGTGYRRVARPVYSRPRRQAPAWALNLHHPSGGVGGKTHAHAFS